jgi:hypothetical protein
VVVDVLVDIIMIVMASCNTIVSFLYLHAVKLLN